MKWLLAAAPAATIARRSVTIMRSARRAERLVDFDLPGTVELIRSAARASRFKAESVHLTLIGLCPDCRERE